MEKGSSSHVGVVLSANCRKIIFALGGVVIQEFNSRHFKVVLETIALEPVVDLVIG